MTRQRAPPASGIDEAIAAFVDAGSDDSGTSLDEFDCWKKLEQKWTT
jgi:ABC-type tungstate transport system permease subunit